jgi:hypothetical protein
MKPDKLQGKTLLRPGEAAVRFNVPLATIYVWYQLGKIDGINVNGKSLRLFSKSLLEFFGSRIPKDV